MARILINKVARWWELDIPNLLSYEEWLDWFKVLRLPKGIKDILEGLKINMCKSKIMGIEVDNGKVSRAATKFGCLVLKAPFLYLGSYVGGDMNKIQSWKDIIDRIRRRLSRWKMKMLSIGGRLMLIKSVLGSMPIFHMSMFKVPAGVIQILESLRSKFFNGHESSGKKASWVQWKKALAPKDNGGLGIFSLYALNRGLIFKWVWRFLAHEPTLWSRVIKAIHGANGKIDEISGKGANSCWINIIKEVRRLEEKGINLLLFMKKKLGNGLSTLFWDDVWCDGGKLKNRFPRAYALENSKQITVGQKLAHPSLYHSFRRHPRGGLELTQVEELAKVINPVVLTQSPDSWSWTLNNSGGYTVASSRNMIDSRLLPKGDLKTRWIRYVPNKVNTFAWKVMTNSLPTRFNISRRGIDIESLSCVNCDVGIETNDHLFFACNTAKKISKLINRWWDVPFMDINSYGEWRSWIDNVKLPKKNKSMFQAQYQSNHIRMNKFSGKHALATWDIKNHQLWVAVKEIMEVYEVLRVMEVQRVLVFLVVLVDVEVQNLIKRCLQLYMNKDEVVKTLLNRARIDPGFTDLDSLVEIGRRECRLILSLLHKAETEEADHPVQSFT
ncbi:RNA-directed DNA polymerase, eukaryota, reverse transcriptase zinc-binding domain protein [Tanacetum coccineum]|uniref:RNA-directed DNA polymerase, eukaryota, reverse transcriptase zinc-binding domain protein n=1 Tax=Tanacetum coccineum TaxID=301880 RepID=A0ABQ5ADL9_9ASTR